MADLETIALTHAGVALEGRIARPAGPGPHPAVLVMYNAHGLGTQVRETAQSLAAEGYVAVATDMYGGGVYHTDMEGAGRSLGPLWQNPDLLRERVQAWHAHVAGLPEVDAGRMAAIGYCFGGQCVLELARSGADVKAVVSYHGILTTSAPAEPDAVKALVAVYTGALDNWVPPADVQAFRDEMIAARARWHLTEYSDAHHGFTHTEGNDAPRGVLYQPLAAELSWAGTRTLLKALL